MSKKKEHHEEHPDETWLIPYADMLTLLLALFIVMFAMSKVDSEKFERMSQEFSVIFSGGSGTLENGVIITPHNEPVEQLSESSIEANKMNEIKKMLDKEAELSGYSDKVIVALNPEGLEVSIQDVLLFKSGEAKVVDEVTPLLLKLTDMLKTLDNEITIAGHTDNQPISTGRFRSNWDLSATRAINVMNFMVEEGGMLPEKFNIQAYGEYKPKYDNTTEEGRAKNRRVEIIIDRKYPVEEKKTE